MECKPFAYWNLRLNFDKILAMRDGHWDEKAEHRWAGKIEHVGRRWLYRVASILTSQKLHTVPFSFDRIQRLLIIKEPYRMGDLMQITPLLRTLRKKFPSIHIGLVIQDRNLPIFQHNPHIDEILVYEKRKFNSQPWLFVKFLNRIGTKKFDLAVTLETQRAHLTNDLIAYFSGAPYRMRYDGSLLGNPESNIFYNLLSPIDTGAVHEVNRNFGVFKPYGLALDDPTLELFVSEQETAKAKSVLQSAAAKILIHPGAYKLNNRWPLENYIALAKKLKEESKREILFVLGPSEHEMEKTIGENGFRVVTGLSILEMAALFRLNGGTVLCNDTGIMHLAAGVGAKTVALFGETDPARWKPPGDAVRVIQSPDKKIGSISVDLVEKMLLP